LVSKTHNTVNLAWTAASDNVGVTAYEVYNGANLAGTTAATSFAINNLSPNTAYVFTVIAKDAANNSSVPSNAVNVTTDNAPITTTTRIEAETNFSILTDVGTVAIASTNGGNAAALSNGLGVRLSDNGDKIRITFNVANSGIYQLKARVRAGNATNPTIFWPNGYRFDLDNVQTTFVGNTATLATLVTNLFGGAVMGTMETTNLNLNAGTHTLDVTVLRSSGAIDYIEIIGQSSGTVDTTPPSAPTLNLVSKTHNTVNLAWTAASDNVGVTAYEVYNGANLAGTTAATSFAINNLSPNTAYVFTVIAKDAANNSSVPSNAVNVTTDNAPITTTTRIEAETNFTILTDVGTVAIASTNGGNATALSNGLGVRLSDNGDKIRITFNVATSGIYQLKARVRAGNATNPTIFWPNGYRFDLDNVQTTFVGNTTTLATLVTNLFGGAVMGTMETTNLNLNAGTHTLDVTVLRGSGAIDYIEVVSISATTTTTMAKSRQDNEAMAEAKEDQIDIKRVYPNPIGNAQIIKIQFTKPLNGVVKYYLIDARGIVLQSGQTGSLGQSEIEFNVGDLKSGAYILQLENNELKSKPIRIVK
jgi:chitodextrinase